MIKDNVKKLLIELPPNALLEAVVKGRAQDEILEAIDAGIKIIGENYIQEAQPIFSLIDHTRVKLHFIGHLQKNKLKRAVEIFDMIETIDSFELACEVNKAAERLNKIMPLLLEVNSAKEGQKFGFFPEDVENAAKRIAVLKNVRICGLMTMGPLMENSEDLRPYFKIANDLFNKIKSLNLSNVDMRYLSMGMSSSYRQAIEEGANIVRIGTGIFGPR